MWFDHWKKQGKKAALTPPDGMTAADIRTQSSICTGETLIGFWDPHTDQLRQAVVVRNRVDIATFYHSYGWEPPCRN